MALHLTIIKFPPGVSLNEDRKTLGPNGGLIGRGVDNDWVLSDPERFLSSRHCQISKEAERYYLTDLSTNGTFVNGSPEPIGRGSRVALNDGDSFDLGDYRFKVAVERDGGFPDAPFDGGGSGATAKGGEFAKTPKNLPESMYMSNDYGGAVSDITPDDMRVIDPLLALDNAKGSGADARGSSADFKSVPRESLGQSPFPSGSTEDSANLMQESASWPEAKAEPGVIPEDWADDISLLGARKPVAGAYKLPEDDSLIVKKDEFSPPKVERDKPVVPQPRQSRTNAAVGSTSTGVRPTAQAAQVKAKTPPRQQQPAEPKSGAASGTADRSMVDAIGLAGVDLSDEQVREINATVGLMMRDSLEGLMQILRSRASIKNEFRINITTIQPVENNPIKFSANVDEIIELMFLRRSKAYKGPVEAVQESFNTIADHQLAVIAGIRSAFRSTMGKFDPVLLEEEFKQMGKGGVLSGVLKGKMWSAYQEYYQKVVNDIERSFQELFGDEFVQAYEDQLRKLAHARKRDV